MKEIIQRGAEAVLYLKKEEGREFLVKERVSKGYRIPELDGKIRRQRTKKEHRIMERAKGSGVSVPSTSLRGDFTLYMDFIKGEKLKDVFSSLEKVEMEKVCERIGETVAALHSEGIVHGDLTTSNMLLSNGRLFLIDFGLSKMSSKAEDQAVDLFLLYEAIKSTHFRYLESAWKTVLKVYGKKYPNSPEILKRLERIRRRRRYK